MASQHTSVVDPMKSKRRAVASSDEEFEAQIVDETFRIGWPYLQSLPVKFESPKSQEEYGSFVFNLDDALASFHAVLASESVDVVAVDLGWQHTIGAKADKTLRVIAQGKPLGKSSWHHAALRLVRSAQELSVDGSPIHVEIVERGFPKLLPMAAEDTACQAWDSLAPKIMDTLSQSSLLWQGLSLVRLGSASSADATPTVLIEAADIIDPRWELMKDALLKASEDSPCDLQVWQLCIKLSV
ncbi:hypothetical protein IWZ01DRAFT_539657 [Phyllosticta capitalensis]